MQHASAVRERRLGPSHHHTMSAKNNLEYVFSRRADVIREKEAKEDKYVQTVNPDVPSSLARASSCSSSGPKLIRKSLSVPTDKSQRDVLDESCLVPLLHPPIAPDTALYKPATATDDRDEGDVGGVVKTSSALSKSDAPAVATAADPLLEKVSSA